MRIVVVVGVLMVAGGVILECPRRVCEMKRYGYSPMKASMHILRYDINIYKMSEFGI